MNTLRMTNVLGEFEKEVTCLQVVHFDNYNIQMDASDKSEYDKMIAFNALNTKARFVLFVKCGGLDRDENPVGMPADLKVSYPVSYPRPKQRRKAV